MSTVQLIDVSKRYGSETILKTINLNIEKGEFVVVVGPSGCGKSTLLRLVSGLDKVDAGQILLNGQCINRLAPASRDVAMVFQSYALYPHMTVFDNIAYGLKMRGLSRDAQKKRVQEMANLLQLTEVLHRKPSALSGGQRQRVAMGRAMSRSPAVCLFDEPLSNLDPTLREEMRREIKQLYQQLKTTCLYVTHDHVEAMTLASQLVVLQAGSIAQSAAPKVVYERPASLFVATFMAVFPLNQIPVSLCEQTKTVLTPLGIKLPGPSQLLSTSRDYILTVRAEAWRLTSDMTPESWPVYLQEIDERGPDRLVLVKTECGQYQFWVRVTGEVNLQQKLTLSIVLSKANLYDKKTGSWIGGWDE